jgi:hypothetical protein
MTGGRWRRCRRGRLLSDLQRDLRPVAPPNVLVLLWRWRYEAGLLAGVPAAIFVLISRLGWVWGPVVIGVTVVTLATWPDARLWLGAHARCVITAHRVRTGCAEAWIHSRRGKLPVILLTSPRPYGERLYIWCRAGTCLEDFQDAVDVLRSACFAADIRVTCSTRSAHIVILDVIREAPVQGPSASWPAPR